MHGIYKVVNTKTGDFYLGSSKDVQLRYKRHLKALRRGQHHSIILQRAWAKYGEENFVLDTLEEVTNPENLLALEEKYLSDLRPRYNVGKNACGGDNITGHPRLDEIKAKHSKNFKALWQDENYRLKATANFSGCNNPGWKGGKSRKECKCGNKISYTSSACMACSKNGPNNPFFGRRHQSDTLSKISAANKGRKPKNARKVMANGVVYESQEAAAKALGVSCGTITHWLSGHVKSPKVPIQLLPFE